MRKKFRAHHILCTALYEGKGYSGDFCDNMSQVVDYLREHADEKLQLVAEPDIICEDCPNRQEDNTCSQDTNHVVVKDRWILKMLGFKEGGIYTYRQMCQQAREKITEAVFLESCGKCKWRAQGLCQYTNLLKQLNQF